MDIKDISFYKYGEDLPEKCRPLYFTNSYFRLCVAEPNILYVCTSVCTVRMENAFSRDAPTIIPVSDFDTSTLECYFKVHNIKVYISSMMAWLQVGNVYIYFPSVTPDFLENLVDAVRAFVENK